MTKQEIFTREVGNLDTIILYLEGNFWRAYQNSAFAFSCNVRQYKATKRYIKSVGEEIISLGFPNTIFKEVTQGLEVVSSLGKQVVFKSPQEITEEDFKRWKLELPLQLGGECSVVEGSILLKMHKKSLQGISLAGFFI